MKASNQAQRLESVSYLVLLQAALGKEKVEVQQGAYLVGRGSDGEIDQAVRAGSTADVCVLLLGMTANNPRVASQVCSYCKL